MCCAQPLVAPCADLLLVLAGNCSKDSNGNRFLRANYMPDVVLIIALQILSHLIFKEPYKEKCYYSHFIDPQTEALRLS